MNDDSWIMHWHAWYSQGALWVAKAVMFIVHIVSSFMLALVLEHALACMEFM